MKKFNKIALSVVAIVAIGMGFSGCDIADESKRPYIEMVSNPVLGSFIRLQSRDDDTIINNIAISGRNGKCDIKDLGAGGSNFLFKFLKYGENIPYDSVRIESFDAGSCPPKNGKYKIELKTNFGTYHYEMGTVD